MSEARSVFKIFGSFGPAGSIVTLVEKLCKRYFHDAYEFGDPKYNKSVEDK